MPKVFIKSKGIWVNFPDSFNEEQITSGVHGILSGNIEVPEAPPAPASTPKPQPPEPGLLERAGSAIRGAADRLGSMNLGQGEEALYDVPEASRKIEQVTGYNPTRMIESDLGTLKAMGSDALQGVGQTAAALNMSVHAAYRQPLEWLLGGFEGITRPQKGEKESVAYKALNLPLKTLARGEKQAGELSGLPDPAKQFLANTAGILGSMTYIGPSIAMGRAGMQALPKLATKLGASEAVAEQLAARPFFESMGAGLGAAVVANKLDVTDPDFPKTAAAFMAFEAAPHIGRAAKQAGRPAFEKLTKKTISESGTPESVYVSADKIWNLHGVAGREKITPEEAQMVKDLGLTGPEYSKAAKNGLTIRIPFEKIVTYGDRPWVQTVKKAFGKDPFIEVRKVKVPGSYEFGPKSSGETVVKRPKTRAEQPAEPQAPALLEGPRAEEAPPAVQTTKTSKEMPLEQLDFERTSDDSVTRAKGYIEQSRQGKKAPREPILVTPAGDGRYRVIDGQATTNAFEQLGEKTIPVEVRDYSNIKPDEITQARDLVDRVVKKKQPELNEVGKELAGTVGGKWFGIPKSTKSLLDKLDRKRKEGLDYPLDKPKDHSRGTVYVKDWADAARVIQGLREKGFEVESTIDAPLNGFGYRGINSSVSLGEGANGEIQIHTQESWDLKMWSDEIYAKWRDVKDASELEKEERIKYFDDKSASQKAWSDYFDKVPLETRASISEAVNRPLEARSSTSALERTAASIMAPQDTGLEGFTQEPSLSSTTGLESASASNLKISPVSNRPTSMRFTEQPPIPSISEETGKVNSPAGKNTAISAGKKNLAPQLRKMIEEHRQAIKDIQHKADMVVDKKLREQPGYKAGKGNSQTKAVKDFIARTRAEELAKRQGQIANHERKIQKLEEQLQKVSNQAPAPEASGITGSSGAAFTEKGTQVDFQYAVYDANELKTSHTDNLTVNQDYPQELQPRDRTRAASIAQVDGILSKLNPALLGENPKVSDGAPIIGPDLVVESGNGRTIALRKGYNSGHKNMEKYREWLVQNAGKFGIDPEELAGIRNPVLVRERTSAIDRGTFVKEANMASVAAMSATEDALADAKVLMDKGILNDLEVTQDGEILTARNTPVMRRFFAETTSQADIGRYIGKDGRINQTGLQKLRNAIFAAAYGDSSVLDVLAESTDDAARNMTRGLLIAAPRLSRAKTKMNAGALVQADITPDIAKAAQEFRRIKESGETLEHRLAQMDMFNPLDPLTADLLNIFERYKRSGAKIGAVLSGYADIWEDIGDPRQVQIFGDGQSFEIGDILRRSLKEVMNAEASKASPSSLFEGPTGGSQGPGSPPRKKAPAGQKVDQAELDRQAQEANAVTLSFMGTGELWDLGKKAFNVVANLKPIRKILHNLGIKDQHDGLVLSSNDYVDLYKYLQMPHDVAIQHPEFKPLYDRQVTRELSKAILDHAFAKKTEPYFNATEADRKKVDKALIGGEQQGIKELDPLTLKEEYGLNDKQIQMYLAIRDALDAAGELLVSEMEDAGVSEEAINEFKSRLAGYVPHKWYGNWAVVVRKPGGKKTVFMSKTGFTDRFKERDRLQQLYPNHDIFIMQSKKVPYEAYQDAAPWAVSKMVDMVIEKADVDPGQADELKQALSDLYKSKGFGQNFIKRKNVPGWTEDLARPLAEYFSGFNGYITKMKAIKGFAEDIKAIDPKKKPNLYRYALDYIRYVTGEQMEFGAAKQLAYVYYLYGNLKSAAVNLTQNLLLGWPVLSKNAKLSGPIMLQAQARAANPRLLSEGERKFVQELEEMGYLDPKLAVEMSAFTSNPLVKSVTGKAGKVAEKIDIFQHVEAWNRRAMAVACYDAGIRDPWKAADLIEEAHFRYAKGNRPHLMRGPISPLMTFRSWAINYITWAKNEAKAGRFGALSRSALAMLLIGGLSAIPGYNLIKKAYIKAFGEDPWSSAARGMGDAAAELAFRGLPTKLGVSLTGSIGMGDILPMDLADAGGVFADVPVRIGKVSKDLAARDYTRALEDASPEMIRQPMAAWRTYDKGDTTRSGAPIYDPTTGKQKQLTPGEAFIKALGFQPARSAESWDLQQTMEQIKETRDAWKQTWANRYVVAMGQGNKKEAADVLREITAYNKQMKEAGRPEDRITKEEMMSAVVARKKAGVPPKYMRPKWKRLLDARGKLPNQ